MGYPDASSTSPVFEVVVPETHMDSIHARLRMESSNATPPSTPSMSSPSPPSSLSPEPRASGSGVPNRRGRQVHPEESDDSEEDEENEDKGEAEAVAMAVVSVVSGDQGQRKGKGRAMSLARKEASVLKGFWSRLDPTKQGRQKRVTASVTQKLSSATNLQIHQLRLVTHLFSLLSKYHSAIHTFSTNSRQLQTHLQRWDTLKALDPTFETESQHLWADVNAFIAVVGEHMQGAGSSGELNWRSAWRLQRKARKLTKRGEEFRDRWERHRKGKEEAKEKGSECMRFMSQAGKHVLEVNEYLEEAVLGLVVMRKVGLTLGNGRPGRL